MDQSTFIGSISIAALLYGLAQFVYNDIEAFNYYQVRRRVFGTTGGPVLMENFGIEKDWILGLVWFLRSITNKV